MGLRYSDGTPATGRLTEQDRARAEKHQGLIAYFDGWSQAQGMKAAVYPRYLDAHELAQWREGWRRARTDRAACDVGT